MDLEYRIFRRDDALYHPSLHQEAGVRNREGNCEGVQKGCARVVRMARITTVIDEAILQEYLGPRKIQWHKRKNEVGLANGLAWTEVSGDIPNRGVAYQGKVAHADRPAWRDNAESAHAALTYVKANQQYFNIKEETIKRYDIHLHVPEGHPERRPVGRYNHGGCCVVVQRDSHEVRCRHDRRDYAARQVLPIGGLKEGAAAHRADIKHVIIPKDNEMDLEKIPQSVRKQMIFHPVSTMEEVLFLALESPEKFFRDSEKTRVLYDKWKETLEEKKEGPEDIATWEENKAVQI